MFGPAVDDVPYKDTTWEVTIRVLAGFCASGSIQVYRFSSGAAKHLCEEKGVTVTIIGVGLE